MSGNWYERLFQALQPSEPFSLSEVGVGVGAGLKYLSESFPNAICSGCDFSKTALEQARKIAPDFEFFHLDIITDTLSDDYDYIILVETLEHFDNPFLIVDKLLKHARNSVIIHSPLNPDGYTGPYQRRFYLRRA